MNWTKPVSRRMSALVLGAALWSWAGAGVAQGAPPPLSRLKPAEPANLKDFVANRQAAIALGKALFWEQRVGSDGLTACASCHFHAGADPRDKNQLSAGPAGAGLAALLDGRINRQLKSGDFPFHKLKDPKNADSNVERSLSLVSSSQGVYLERFDGIDTGQAEDRRTLLRDPVFNVGGINVRQVEPRNSPTVINAVFNLRNFWDGRAQTIFNGVNAWGKRDAAARVYRNVYQTSSSGGSWRVMPVAVTINDASLASQAVAPPLSGLEMSAGGRQFPDLGRKLLALRPLATQAVAPDDSVLGEWRHASGMGLSVGSYADAVKAAFQPEWWNGSQSVVIDGRSYRQIEANFSLFWGLALQLYQATLVSDQAPYDRWAAGDAKALDGKALTGLGVFLGKGKCIECHGGPVFTNAAIVRKPLATERMSLMVMGDGRPAVYDEGFYNIGVTRSADDVGLGGKDPWGRPLSFSGLAAQSTSLFAVLELDAPNLAVSPQSRIAVNGAFKTPTLRNVALTAPYFHDGGTATLKQVVEFYNRGGNFARVNRADLDADIEPLGLSGAEQDALVAFMRALTDERVRLHAAPFDHPSLTVPHGHVGDGKKTTNDGTGRAVEERLVLPAVGAQGYKKDKAPKPFLDINQ